MKLFVHWDAGWCAKSDTLTAFGLASNLKLAHVPSASHIIPNSSVVTSNDLSKITASGGGRAASSPPMALSSDEDL